MSAHVKPRTQLHKDILKLLEAGPLDARDIVSRTHSPFNAVGSCLVGMVNHGEVVRLKCRLGRWAKYRAVSP